MAKLRLQAEILTFGILLLLCSEVSANAVFYTRLKLTSLMYSSELKNRASTQFTSTATDIQNLIQEALTANETNTILTDQTIQKVEVKTFSPGVSLIPVILIAVLDHPEVEFAVADALETAVEDDALGNVIVEANSLKIVYMQDECSNGNVIDFTTETCKPCPIGTYQKSGERGQCDACPRDSDTVAMGTVGKSNCKSFCELDENYCNGGNCAYTETQGVVCDCSFDSSVRLGGKRCEELITFYVSFDITSREFSDQLKDKSSQNYKNMSSLARGLVIDTLVRSNNPLLSVNKLHAVTVLTFEPGLNAAFEIDVVDASAIDTTMTSVLTTAIQSGTIKEETVGTDSLVIINNIIPCIRGSIMDFAERICEKCPIGTYDPFGLPGQCEECPIGSNTSSTGTTGKFRCLAFCNINTDYCMNGGTCQFITEGDDIGEKCTCPYDYSGQRCENVLTLVENVVPKFGPESGGTTITITGLNFDLTRSLSVVIGDSVCTDVTGNETMIKCTTGQFNKSAFSFREKLDMTLSYMSPPEVAPVAARVFSYRRIPRIEEIKPLASFRSGGLMLTVLGRYLDAAYEPKLMTTVTTNDNETTLNSDCIVKDSYELLCPTPEIENDLGTREATPSVIEVTLGFLFDGVTKYHDLTANLASYSTITIFPNPEITKFNPQVRSFNRNVTTKLTIEGKHFNHDSILGSFYRVMIGTTECSNLQIKSTELQCETPLKPSNSSNYKVTVNVGNLQFVPGYLKYTSGSWNNEFAITAIVWTAIGVAGFIVLAVAAWIFGSVFQFEKTGPKGKDSHNTSLVRYNEDEEDAVSIVPNPMEGYVNTPVEGYVNTPVKGQVNTPVEGQVNTPVEGQVNPPVDEYTQEEMPKFNSARFYTSHSRGRAYATPAGSMSNSQTFMY